MIGEVINAVEGYLIGARTLRDVESWLASRTRAIHQSGDERAVKLANELEADLVELGERLLDDADIRGRWEGHLGRMTTLAWETTASPTQTITSSESKTLRSSYAPDSDITLWVTHQFAGA